MTLNAAYANQQITVVSTMINLMCYKQSTSQKCYRLVERERSYVVA